jgi:hypothetical protein
MSGRGEQSLSSTKLGGLHRTRANAHVACYRMARDLARARGPAIPKRVGGRIFPDLAMTRDGA